MKTVYKIRTKNVGPRRHSAEAIAQSLTEAIAERQWQPGRKLVESRLGEQFGVSRTIIREALHLLAADRLVQMEPDRGAFVASPSPEETRQIFATRRLVETAMIGEFAQTATPQQIARLREHLAEEQAAVARTDVTVRTRLLADFHVEIASTLGNAVLADLIRELVYRTTLVTLLYQTSHAAADSSNDHLAILEACAHHDVAAAQRLMQEHLQAVEAHLLSPQSPPRELS